MSNTTGTRTEMATESSANAERHRKRRLGRASRFTHLGAVVTAVLLTGCVTAHDQPSDRTTGNKPDTTTSEPQPFGAAGSQEIPPPFVSGNGLGEFDQSDPGDVDCDQIDDLCEFGDLACDDLADYCDAGPDGLAPLPDEFDPDQG
jgi:hypothetical protein